MQQVYPTTSVYYTRCADITFDAPKHGVRIKRLTIILYKGGLSKVQNLQEYHKQLDAVQKRVKKIDDMLVSLERDLPFCDSEDLMRKCESIYAQCATVLIEMKNLYVDMFGEEKFDEMTERLFDRDEFKDEQRVAVNFDARGWARILCPTPPVLGSNYAVTKFKEVFCLYLQRKVSMALPKQFRKMRAAVVVYNNHFIPERTKKQPYFNNDNLAIKAILDAVVPIVCIDDATLFCDNLYTSQPDSRQYVELFLVEKSSYSLWKRSYSGLPICREYTE